jgi:ribonuclease J
VAVSHSVPDALSIVVETDLGAVVLTGDYRFDHTPIDGRVTDVDRFAQLGRQGVLALLGDSTNVEAPGSTASESTIGQAFHQIFAEAEGRVIVASFASHIHRVQQAITIAHLHGRKFAISGRSMQKNVNIARNLGYLDVPDGSMIKLAAIDDYRPEEILILSTGSQGEPLSALTRMAFGDHSQVALHEGDTVVISAKAIPGNEVSVMATVNRLLKSGASVIYGEGSGVHVSGHAAREDLRMMINLLRPQYFVPVHGEYRHQHYHAQLARESGLRDEDIIILENGDVLELDAENAEIVGQVPAGMVFVDGFELGDEEGIVLRDRQQLAGDGILIAVVTVDAQNGRTVAPPELVARGFLHNDERLKDVLDECRSALDELMQKLGEVHVTGRRLIQEDIKEKMAGIVYARTRHRPLILPVVVEV